LIGYAIGLPGQVALGIVMRSFYALKNAVIPLLINILGFAIRLSLLLFLFNTLTGKYTILAIPLAATGTTTLEAGLLSLLLLWRLRVGIKEEQGNLLTPALEPTGISEQPDEVD
jgi:peptidoglycan biosynthesis protein MviN/MurJ (putative lipid II flippase)